MAKSEVFAQKPQGDELWDIAIIGSGPAAFTAAIYTTRGAASTIIVGGEKWGGQLMLTTTVDNYPALPGIQGPDLMQKMRDHVLLFGAEFVAKNVESVNFKSEVEGTFELTAGGNKFAAKSVIIATGADTRWLGVPGESKLIGRGISSCAPCDAPFFKNKKVVVVGGGDSAMEEANVLTNYATEVTIIHRRDAFRASAVMQKKVLANPKVKVLWNTEVVEFKGVEKLEGLILKNNKTGESSEVAADGAFIAIGHIPVTDIFRGHIELDEKGYVKKSQNSNLKTQSYQMATSVPGVFVAGDVHDYHYRQAVTAAAFGCMAGMEALKYLGKSGPNW